ncbi:LysR family transcriptional regulator [Lacibacterium aquatile]|uniref:LysR family transcriptional regulator n=1 Tax=Lacibacterium aquatile TaxID=1168082 RepID=A0ABW5DPN3_9PROT
MRVFAALADTDSLSAAARRLGITHATVGRRIARLEEHLGGLLFERVEGRLQLSPLGQRVRQDVVAMQARAEAVLQTAKLENRTSTVVRLSLPRTMADHFLAPNLDGVVGPEVELLLSTDSRIVSIAKDESDIAIRLGRPKDSETIGRRVADIRYRVYAHRDLMTPETACLIDAEAEEDYAEVQWFRRQYPDRPVAFRSGSQIARRGAAEAGLGLALLPSFIVQPGSPLTALPLNGQEPPVREVWLLARQNKLRSPEIRATYDRLAQLFKDRFP